MNRERKRVPLEGGDERKGRLASKVRENGRTRKKPPVSALLPTLGKIAGTTRFLDSMVNFGLGA